MSNLTRKSFLGSLVAATAATTLGYAAKPTFKDIDPDLHYFVNHIGGYADIVGYKVIKRLVEIIHKHPQVINGKDLWEFEIIEKETDNSIFISPSWLKEFYRRHS